VPGQEANQPVYELLRRRSRGVGDRIERGHSRASARAARRIRAERPSSLVYQGKTGPSHIFFKTSARDVEGNRLAQSARQLRALMIRSLTVGAVSTSPSGRRLHGVELGRRSQARSSHRA